eukprot:5974037-Pyramimonas_sp.AAC.1
MGGGGAGAGVCADAGGERVRRRLAGEFLRAAGAGKGAVGSGRARLIYRRIGSEERLRRRFSEEGFASECFRLTKTESRTETLLKLWTFFLLAAAGVQLFAGHGPAGELPLPRDGLVRELCAVVRAARGAAANGGDGQLIHQRARTHAAGAAHRPPVRAAANQRS